MYAVRDYFKICVICLVAPVIISSVAPEEKLRSKSKAAVTVGIYPYILT